MLTTPTVRLFLCSLLVPGALAFAEGKDSGNSGFINQFANACLETLDKALVIAAPTVAPQTTVPRSSLTFFPCDHNWDCGSEQPPQVTTVDASILEKGAVSAVVTSDGKVMQVMANGTCNLSAKRFGSSYDFIAAQMGGKHYGEVVRGILAKDAKEKSFVSKRCGGVSSTGRTAKLYAALVDAQLITPENPSSKSSPAPSPANQ